MTALILRLLGPAALATLKGLPWGRLAIGGLVVAIVVAFGVVKCQRDRAVLSATNAKRTVKVDGATIGTLTTARKADDVAGVQHAADQTHRAAETAALKESTDALPSHALSDRQRARLVCLRAERQARDAGQPVPACGPASPRP